MYNCKQCLKCKTGWVRTSQNSACMQTATAMLQTIALAGEKADRGWKMGSTDLQAIACAFILFSMISCSIISVCCYTYVPLFVLLTCNLQASTVNTIFTHMYLCLAI